MLPSAVETWEVQGVAGRVWTVRMPPAADWLMGGEVAQALAMGAADGVNLARVMHEPPERRAALLVEMWTAPRQVDPEHQREQAARLLELLGYVLPGAVVACTWREQTQRVQVVLELRDETPHDAGEVEIEYRAVGNPALLGDWVAIWRSLRDRSGQGAARGRSFRDGVSRGPDGGGRDGAPVRDAAEQHPGRG